MACSCTASSAEELRDGLPSWMGFSQAEPAADAQPQQPPASNKVLLTG